MQNICIHCHSDDVPMAYIEGHTIHACHHCGTVHVQDKGFILTVDTALESPLYAVARGIAELYKQFGSMDNVPFNEGA
jgi:hypothetical protein